MTIIAVKDGIMAADTGVFSNGVFCGTARKWAPVEAGGFIGVAGELGKAQAVLNTNLRHEPLKESFVADCIMWMNGDEVWEKYGEGPWCQVEADFWAIGSGEEMARGAMAAGASAEEAVAICIKYQTECAGEVEVAK